MKRLALLFAVVPLMVPMTVFAAPERWLEVAPRDAAHGGMAVNLGSVRPSETKGLDDATAMEVLDAKSVWLTRYEVRCGRGLMHQIERHGLDPKSGKLGPSAPVEGDWAKPQGDGELRILDIVCRPDSAGGDVISDRRAMIWLLAR